MRNLSGGIVAQNVAMRDEHIRAILEHAQRIRIGPLMIAWTTTTFPSASSISTTSTRNAGTACVKPFQKASIPPRIGTMFVRP